MGLLRQSPIMLLIGLIGCAMLGPSLLGALDGDWRAARLFLFSAIFTIFAALVGGLAMGPRKSHGAPAEMRIVFASFAIAPAFAAAPIWLLSPALGMQGAYFEALSCFTTTGASLIAEPQSSPRAVQLWRCLLAWMGGGVFLIAAGGILSKHGALGAPAARSAGLARVGRLLSLGRLEVRLDQAVREIAPLYIGLTGLLTVLLALTGLPGFLALTHAMGVMSTSGVSPLPEGLAGLQSRLAEGLALIFMLAAASRLTFTSPSVRALRVRAAEDPELRLMAIAVVACALWLFLRHWMGAIEANDDSFAKGFAALWGGLFTAASFLTTTGYTSMDWAAARDWSGLDSPALVLLGLATLGGGVASTAGGVKLMRSYALFTHGAAELSRLSYPNLVARTPLGADRGMAIAALVFLMLFLIGLGLILLALTLGGLDFERALVSAIAALTNTGPAFPTVLGERGQYILLGDAAHWTLCAAMLLGRLEVLTLIAMIGPLRAR